MRYIVWIGMAEISGIIIILNLHKSKVGKKKRLDDGGEEGKTHELKMIKKRANKNKLKKEK